MRAPSLHTLALALALLTACRSGGGAPGSAWLGCKSRGCPSGSYCDEKTRYCASARCSEGCPAGTRCNTALDACEGAPASSLGHHEQASPATPRNPLTGTQRELWAEPPP